MSVEQVIDGQRALRSVEPSQVENKNPDLAYAVVDGQQCLVVSCVNGGSIVGDEAPTTSTAADIGKIYVDSTNGDAYICVAFDDTDDTYTWKQITS